MNIGRGQLPDGDWMKTDEVAEVLSVAMDTPMDADTVRRWIRRGHQHLHGLDVWQPGREYLVERESMLRMLEYRRDQIQAAIDMTKKGPAQSED